MGKHQCKAFWKVSNFLSHHRSLPLPVSQNSLSAACRWGDNGGCGSGGPRAMPALTELCPPCQHCCSWPSCRDSDNALYAPWTSPCRLLLLTQPGRGETILHHQYCNVNLRNPMRTCPSPKPASLARDSQGYHCSLKDRVQYIIAGFPAILLKENAFLPASTPLPLYHSDLVRKLLTSTLCSVFIYTNAPYTQTKTLHRPGLTAKCCW